LAIKIDVAILVMKGIIMEEHSRGLDLVFEKEDIADAWFDVSSRARDTVHTSWLDMLKIGLLSIPQVNEVILERYHGACSPRAILKKLTVTISSSPNPYDIDDEDMLGRVKCAVVRLLQTPPSQEEVDKVAALKYKIDHCFRTVG
jgi:hypothetical protein